MMRAALDTNVLAYAEGIDDPGCQAIALSLIEYVSCHEIIVPVQVLGELFLPNHTLTLSASHSQ